MNGLPLAKEEVNDHIERVYWYESHIRAVHIRVAELEVGHHLAGEISFSDQKKTASGNDAVYE